MRLREYQFILEKCEEKLTTYQTSDRVLKKVG